MTRKNGASRTSLTAEDRLSVITTSEIGNRVRLAAYHTNLTLSDVVNWCLEASLDEFLRQNKNRVPPKIRPGRKMRLAP